MNKSNFICRYKSNNEGDPCAAHGRRKGKDRLIIIRGKCARAAIYSSKVGVVRADHAFFIASASLAENGRHVQAREEQQQR